MRTDVRRPARFAQVEVDRVVLDPFSQRHAVTGATADDRIPGVPGILEPVLEADLDLAGHQVAAAVHPGAGVADQHGGLPQRAAQVGVVGAVAVPIRFRGIWPVCSVAAAVLRKPLRGQQTEASVPLKVNR